MNSGIFKIVEDVSFQDGSMNKLLNYLAQRIPLFDFYIWNGTLRIAILIKSLIIKELK